MIENTYKEESTVYFNLDDVTLAVEKHTGGRCTVKRQTLYRDIRLGYLDAGKLGIEYVCTPEALAEYLEKRWTPKRRVRKISA